MNELALYAGGGGGLLASRLLGWSTVCYVERDPFCVQVIKARIKDGWLDDAPIWDNAKTFAGRRWRGLVDVVSGGFPCQPFSGAGKRLADRDPRNLWPATLRIIRAVQPEWCFLENVSRLITYPYFGRILGDLAESGFDCTWECLPASAVGAPHQRDRVWIVAHAMQGGRGTRWPGGLAASGKGKFIAERPLHEQLLADTIEPRLQGRPRKGDGSTGGAYVVPSDGGDEVSHSNFGGLSEPAHEQTSQGDIRRRADPVGSGLGRPSWWLTEPKLGRMAYGVANRVDRLKAIGNGQVPAVAVAAWRLLSQRLIEE